MADDVTLPGTGAVVATDDVGGRQFQLVKLAVGGDGVADQVDAAHPIPVEMQGTVPVSAAALPLPTGAATETTLAAVNAKLPALSGGRIPVELPAGGGGLTDTELRAAPVQVAPTLVPIDFWPSYSGAESTATASQRVDGDGATLIRGAVLTDEGTYRVNFANTSLGVSIGSVTISGTAVTGAGFLAADVHRGDYIKLDADGDTAWRQIDTIDTDTSITLAAAYVGGASGAASRSLVLPIFGAGGSLTVASGACTLTAGTTSGGGVTLAREVDYAPLVFRSRLSLSQRIANQSTRIGLIDPSSLGRWFARFRLEGTTNTIAVCETGRNPTGAPSAAETESTTITLPHGANTGQSLEYRVEMMTERAIFYVNNVAVAEHTRVLPQAYDVMATGIRIENTGTPASGTTALVDFITCKNHNKLEAGFLSDTEKVAAAQVPAQMFSYTAGAVVIPINTDIMLIDCSQLRSLSILSGAVGTTGVVTGAWSNDGVTDWITATLVSETGATSTTFTGATALLRTTTVRARYFRLRMTTATTAAGATRINVAGFQADLSPTVATQPISGSVTASGTVTANQGTLVAPTANILNSAATTNGTVVKASAGTLYSITVSNTNAAVRYLKLYNSTTVTVGTTAVVLTIPIPAGGVVTVPFGTTGMRFGTGICISTTTGAADADVGAVAAGEIKVLTSFI